MAMTAVEVPRVARIHYDGEANLFRLKITALLESPLGNFPFTATVTDTQLLNIVQAILEEWLLNMSHSSVPATVEFNVGDKTAFIAWCEANLP